jgi:hypothetical protein
MKKTLYCGGIIVALGAATLMHWTGLRGQQALAADAVKVAPEAPQHPTVLLELQSSLKNMLQQSAPEAVVSFEGQELVVKYRVMKFMVHDLIPGGKSYNDPHFATQAHAEMGPDAAGFVLYVGVGHGMRPQKPNDWLAAGPYWQGWGADYAIKAADSPRAELDASLSYGHFADVAVIKKLEAIVLQAARNHGYSGAASEQITQWRE